MSEDELRKRLGTKDLMLRKAMSLIIAKPTDVRTEGEAAVMENYIKHCETERMLG